MIWRGRFATMRAAGVLIAAHLLVKFGSLAAIRRILARDAVSDPAQDLPLARAVGRRVERAAGRLPFATRCLARAVATKWLLDRRGAEAQLVIAVHRRDRSGEDAFHAWVEQGGEILVGHCVREDYAPVMSIE